MSAVEQLLDEKKCVIERVQGMGLDNTPLYAYVLMAKNRLQEFRTALAQRDVDLAEFGIILEQGAGEVPVDLEARVLQALRNH